MIADLAIEIIELAVSLAANPKGQSVAGTLVQIVQKGVLGYEQETGLPLDPNLIKPEAPV